MSTIALSLLSLPLLALQSSGVFPFSWGDVSADLCICLVVHLALTRPLSTGGAAATVIGYVVDLSMGAPAGLHVVTFTTVFLIGYAVRYRLFLGAVPTAAMVTFLASLAATGVTGFLAAVFLRDYHQYGAFLYLAIPRALLTVPFTFPLRSLAIAVDETFSASAVGRGPVH